MVSYEDLLDLFRTGGTPEWHRLKELLDSLTAPQIHELCGVMWVGRGDDDDFDRLVRHAERMSDAGDRVYLLGKLPLGEYLRCGLARLRVRKAGLIATEKAFADD